MCIYVHELLRNSNGQIQHFIYMSLFLFIYICVRQKWLCTCSQLNQLIIKKTAEAYDPFKHVLHVFCAVNGRCHSTARVGISIAKVSICFFFFFEIQLTWKFVPNLWKMLLEFREIPLKLEKVLLFITHINNT